MEGRLRFSRLRRSVASVALLAASAGVSAAQPVSSAESTLGEEPIEVQVHTQTDDSLRLREPTLSVDVDVSLFLGDEERPTRQRRWFRRSLLFLTAGVAGLVGSVIGLTQRSNRRAECSATMECELPWGRRDAIGAGAMGTSSIVMFGGLMGLVIRGLTRASRRIEAAQQRATWTPRLRRST